MEEGENSGAAAAAASAEDGRVVCCVDDIHGFYDKLLRLWANLEARVGAAVFRTALVIFLGDYCDRGPQTREVIDFLLSLSAWYPEQSHVFLCGNHDLAFAAFVGALPPPPDGSPFSATWVEYEVNGRDGSGERAMRGCTCRGGGGGGGERYRTGGTPRRAWNTWAPSTTPAPRSSPTASPMAPLIYVKQSRRSTKSFLQAWFGSMRRFLICNSKSETG